MALLTRTTQAVILVHSSDDAVKAPEGFDADDHRFGGWLPAHMCECASGALRWYASPLSGTDNTRVLAAGDRRVWVALTCSIRRVDGRPHGMSVEDVIGAVCRDRNVAAGLYGIVDRITDGEEIEWLPPAPEEGVAAEAPKREDG
jgi:hypothetical protein